MSASGVHLYGNSRSNAAINKIGDFWKVIVREGIVADFDGCFHSTKLVIPHFKMIEKICSFPLRCYFIFLLYTGKDLYNSAVFFNNLKSQNLFMKKSIIVGGFLLLGQFTLAQLPTQNNINTAVNVNYSSFNRKLNGTGDPCNTASMFYQGARMGIFQMGEMYSSGSGTSSPTREAYYTTPNSGAFYRVNALPLNTEVGENDYYTEIPVAGPNGPCTINSTQTAWFLLENPNTSSVAYRFNTYNHYELSNVETAIAIYKLNPVANTPINNFYGLDANGNTIPRYIRLAIVNNSTQGLVDLTDPTNILNNGFPFYTPSYPDKIIPKATTYSTLFGNNWSFGRVYNCTSFFDQPVLDQTDITLPMGPGAAQNPNDFLNQAYIELFNAAPNERYYIQVLVYPNNDLSAQCTSDERYFTLSVHAEIVSKDSYVQDASGNFVFNEPVYVVPTSNYFKNVTATGVNTIAVDSERSFVLTSPNSMVINDPDGNQSGSGYWWGSSNSVGVSASLYFHLQGVVNQYGIGSFGSSMPSFDIVGINNIRGVQQNIGLMNMDDTPIDSDDNRGHNYNFSYNFGGSIGGNTFSSKLATYSAHASYLSSEIGSMEVWQNQPPQIVVNTDEPVIVDQSSNAKISIIPNPSGGAIQLTLNEINSDVYSMEIFSLDGRSVAFFEGDYFMLNDYLNENPIAQNGEYIMVLLNYTAGVNESLKFVIGK